MRRAMAQIRHVTLRPKPISEAASCERLAQFVDQERELAIGADQRLQFWMYRDQKFGAGLLLANVKRSIAEVLAAHAHHIAAPLSRI